MRFYLGVFNDIVIWKGVIKFIFRVYIFMGGDFNGRYQYLYDKEVVWFFIECIKSDVKYENVYIYLFIIML